MNMLDDVEFQVKKLELGKDDLLVVRPEKPISSVIATELRAQLERQHNLAGRVLVMAAGMDASSVSSAATKPDSRPQTKAAGAKA